MERAALPSTPPAIDDLSIVSRIRAGDRAAFELLMRRHNRRLYRLARATLRDEAEAEDALQDAYLSAYRSIGQFRGDAALVTWLSRLVLNECFARLRRTARRQRVIPMVEWTTDVEVDAMAQAEDHASSPDKAAATAEMRALLERKLDEMPEVFRVVFVLRSVEEMSVEETALCLGIPEATVRSRHFRARSLLRESLARDIDLAEPGLFEFCGAQCDRVVASVLHRLGEES
ncbi:RNA polymerase sigma factor [Caballeronia humi]|uniref:RNA polymerase sigma factor n=1 Tax=Caballeronia humi TaxID=326474 RepID=A0A158G0X5_9BURK|nr:RNA polymerase sigma factor [Caballeronia humi]SAL25725.1 RNA polymerase sigma factor [Caballeronia humi]